MQESKKLFFGVSQKDLDKQKRIADEKAARTAAQEKAETDNAERTALLQQFGVNLDRYKDEKKQAVKDTVFGCVMGVAFWACLSFFVNGFIDSFQEKEVGGEAWTKSVVNPFVDGKFAPTATWYRQLAFLIVSLCVAVGTSRTYSKYYREDKARVNAVDMMLGLKEFGRKYKLNSRQVKHLLHTVDFVIKGMSQDNRIYFDMLMNGDINIKNNKVFMDMAVAVMTGHLESHPEDAQLILDTFEEKSLPDVLLYKCKTVQEQAR